jgi:hypothetical protein
VEPELSLLVTHHIDRLSRRFSWMQRRDFVTAACLFHVTAFLIGVWEDRPTMAFHVMVSLWPMLYLGGLVIMGEPQDQLELTDRTIRRRFWRARWWDYALSITSHFLATGMVIAFDRDPQEPHLWWRAPIYAFSGVFLPWLYLEAIRTKIKVRRLREHANMDTAP